MQPIIRLEEVLAVLEKQKIHKSIQVHKLYTPVGDKQPHRLHLSLPLWVLMLTVPLQETQYALGEQLLSPNKSRG